MGKKFVTSSWGSPSKYVTSYASFAVAALMLFLVVGDMALHNRPGSAVRSVRSVS
jgi:hypothetical protein